MTPTPPSTNPSTGAQSPEESYRVVRKRNRVPLSCYPCRMRKKCDRNHPCSNCTKRDGVGTTSCSYAAPPRSRRKSQNPKRQSPDDMQNRIDRLENLVLSLMHDGPNADVSPPAGNSQANTESGSSARTGVDDGTAPADEDEEDIDDDLAASIGVLKVDADKGKSIYLGQTHWHILLSDISEVKNYFLYHKKELQNCHERVSSSQSHSERDGPLLLLGVAPASGVEILAKLPSKFAVITLCNRYFNSMDGSVSIIHAPTFHQQLRNHWHDPSKTSLSWLGLLYSVMCLAMLSYHKVGDEPQEWRGRTFELAAEYRLRTVQCLRRGEYTKPGEYTIETMVLYVFGEYSSGWEADVALWLIMSLITRLAFCLGYHRDPKWFPSISPFQAEMRRRTWALLRMSDVIFSHQVSLPSMIYEDDCDTQLPSNLYDNDLYPDMKVLPPSRPDSDATPISYMVAKARLCFKLGKILSATNNVHKPAGYDEITRFDAQIGQIMRELPPHLKMAPWERSSVPVDLIIARFNLDILYIKIMCLLHRKYLPRARQNPRYAHSRERVIDASIRALDHLQTLIHHSQPNGRLQSMEWYIKSIATRDFVLPAALVTLDLHFDNLSMKSGTTAASGCRLLSPEMRTKMIHSLEAALEIWKSLADTSMEAFKASKITELMLQKIKSPDDPKLQRMCPPEPDSVESLPAKFDLGNSGSTMAESLPRSDMDNSNAEPDGLRSATGVAPFMEMDIGLTPNATHFGVEGYGMGGAASPFSIWGNTSGEDSTVDLPSTFDWGAFENYTQMATWGTDQSFQLYSNAMGSKPEDEPDFSMLASEDQADMP